MMVKLCQCCFERDTIEAYREVEISFYLFLTSVVSSQLHPPAGLPPVGEFHGRFGGAEEIILLLQPGMEPGFPGRQPVA
jgi:hypothetical protein